FDFEVCQRIPRDPSPSVSFHSASTWSRPFPSPGPRLGGGTSFVPRSAFNGDIDEGVPGNPSENKGILVALKPEFLHEPVHEVRRGPAQSLHSETPFVILRQQFDRHPVQLGRGTNGK